jgi:hypothetical protein
MPRKIDEVNCPIEREILQTMKMATAGQDGYAPHDTPILTSQLAIHRRGCPFCNGTALTQLFGGQTVVVVPLEASHATQESVG